MENKMFKNNIRSFATPLTSIIFLVIGISGVLMYFHLLDKYTRNIHEIFGLVFVVVSLFHIFFNWKSMKNYFNKNIFRISLITVLIVISGFIYSSSSSRAEDPKEVIIESVLNLKIEDVSKILGKDIENVKNSFGKENIKFVNEKTIIELSDINKVSPFMIIYIINSETK
jgi:hypothetical protein